MEDVARVYLEPTDLAVRIVGAQDTKPGAVVVIPSVGHVGPALDRDV
jgi:hypothetical protein